MERSMNFYDTETKYSMPALQRTGKIVLPEHSKMTARASWINSYIHSGLGDVIFTWHGDEYIVKRISKMNKDFYSVVFDDYAGEQRVVPLYRFTEIRIPMGEE